jgi:hypothetical protein
MTDSTCRIELYSPLKLHGSQSSFPSSCNFKVPIQRQGHLRQEKSTLHTRCEYRAARSSTERRHQHSELPSIK